MMSFNKSEIMSRVILLFSSRKGVIKQSMVSELFIDREIILLKCVSPNYQIYYLIDTEYGVDTIKGFSRPVKILATVASDRQANRVCEILSDIYDLCPGYLLEIESHKWEGIVLLATDDNSDELIIKKLRSA